MTLDELKIGQKVTYVPAFGKPENGIVKSVRPSKRIAWVVYNCAGNWHRYQDYTAAATDWNDLQPGWLDL